MCWLECDNQSSYEQLIDMQKCDDQLTFYQVVLLSTQVPDLAAAHTCAYPLVSWDRVCNLLSDLIEPYRWYRYRERY